MESPWKGHDPRGLRLRGHLVPPPSGPGTTNTQNLTDKETLKRTFHDTANRCHDNCSCSTPVVLDGHAGEVERLQPQQPSTVTPRAFFFLRRVRLAASRSLLLRRMTGGPLGDDPDSDGATAISDEMGPSGSSFEQLQEGGLQVRCTTTSGCLFFFRILGALCGRRGSVQLGGLSHMTL